jgi:hypothetical protein
MQTSRAQRFMMRSSLKWETEKSTAGVSSKNQKLLWFLKSVTWNFEASCLHKLTLWHPSRACKLFMIEHAINTHSAAAIQKHISTQNSTHKLNKYSVSLKVKTGGAPGSDDSSSCTTMSQPPLLDIKRKSPLSKTTAIGQHRGFSAHLGLQNSHLKKRRPSEPCLEFDVTSEKSLIDANKTLSPKQNSYTIEIPQCLMSMRITFITKLL